MHFAHFGTVIARQYPDVTAQNYADGNGWSDRAVPYLPRWRWGRSDPPICLPTARSMANGNYVRDPKVGIEGSGTRSLRGA